MAQEYGNVAEHEPAPIKNDGPCIQDLAVIDVIQLGDTFEGGHQIGRAFRDVADAIVARKEAGVKKYGTVLQPHNGRNALLDLYQELLDGIVYFKQVLVELDSISDLDERAMRKWVLLPSYTGLVDLAAKIAYTLKNYDNPPKTRKEAAAEGQK